MTDSVRERIQQAVKAALVAVPGLAGVGQIERNRDAHPLRLPAVSIMDRGDTPVLQEIYRLVRLLNLEIIVDVDGDGAAGMTASFDAWQILIHRALLADDQWGGLATTTTLLGLEPDIAEGADVAEVTFRFSLSIEYATSRTDPTIQ